LDILRAEEVGEEKRSLLTLGLVRAVDSSLAANRGDLLTSEKT